MATVLTTIALFTNFAAKLTAKCKRGGCIKIGPVSNGDNSSNIPEFQCNMEALPICKKVGFDFSGIAANLTAASVCEYAAYKVCKSK